MRNRAQSALFICAILAALQASAQSPVCTELRYGTATQARTIEETQQTGSVDEAVAAIRVAQRTRGNDLGCTEAAYALSGSDVRAPSLAAIRAAWNAQVSAAAAALVVYDGCPAIGRGAGAYALGGWTARAGGLAFPEPALNALAENLIHTQYGADKTPGEQTTWTGMFGYAQRLGEAGNACFVPGIVGEGVGVACDTAPGLCALYRRGRFANERFVVGDFLAGSNLRDGGGAFDHGWAGVMMIEAALGTSDRAAAARYRQAALAAADWAVTEPAVRNHNYTAKLIWLLAAAYDWTGESRYRAALIDKLERSLLPGVLMDQNADGEVDGVPGVRFSALRAPAARQPGRMWDAHNALPQYQAMNAIALVEAFAAFNARGDVEMRDRVKPFAIAVLDNQASEFQAGNGTAGATQAAYAFAVGLWKLSDPENLPRPLWEQAFWRIWNAGLGASPGDSKTAAAAVISVRAEGRVWRAYRHRGAASETTAPFDARISGLWFDPARAGEGLNLTLIAPNRLVVAWYTYKADGSGEPQWIAADGGFDGRRFSAAAFTLRGTRFGSGFNPADVQQTRWGELTMDFSRCDSAVLTWRSDVAGFGTGSRSLIRLAGVLDNDC